MRFPASGLYESPDGRPLDGTLRVTAPNAWRDMDSEYSRCGLVVSRYGATLLIGRRIYRVIWSDR